MLALVGSNGSFAQGREQLEALAGLNITTKAVERHAEAIGGDIAAGARLLWRGDPEYAAYAWRRDHRRK